MSVRTFVIMAWSVALVLLTSCSNQQLDNVHISGEEDLALEKALSNCPVLAGEDFDPVLLLRSANQIQRLGQAEASRQIRCHWKRHRATASSTIAQKLFVILRCIYLPAEPDGLQVPLAIGQPAYFSQNLTTSDFPAYPFYVASDIPFLIEAGFMLSGLSADPLEYLNYCEKHYRFREYPFSPTASPIDVIGALFDSKAWSRIDRTSSLQERFLGKDVAIFHAQMMCKQAARCIIGTDSITDRTARDSLRASQLEFANTWALLRLRCSQLVVTWDPTEQQFRVSSR